MKRLHEVLERTGAAASSWLSPRETPPARPLFVVAPAASVGLDPAELARQVDEARAEAELEGLKAAQDKVEAVIERYMDGIQRLAEVAREARRPVPDEVVALAVIVAREILGRELSVDRDAILDTVDRALREVDGEDDITLRLGHADLAYVQKRRPELAGAGVTLVEDDAITVGGCIVESANIVTDATIDARLRAVARALAEIARTEAAAPDAPAHDDDEAPAC